MISATTRLCGVIGDPVSHTLSPGMHNAAMQHLELDYAYLAFQVKPADLQAAVEGMKALGFTGLNVTIPHKVSVIPFLDELDAAAKDIGAVNTIVNNRGRLKGYNTDAGGFLQSITSSGFAPRGKNVILLGAGGAARAIGFALVRAGAHITILNRKEDFDLAVSLARGLSQSGGDEVKALELNDSNLKASLDNASLLANATSVGMEPEPSLTPVPAEFLKSGLIVFDVVYAPLETRLLREAKNRGCQTISGLEMLVRQGALSFELWTGKKAPLDVMREAAIPALGSVKTIAPETEATRKSPGKSKTSVALIGFMGSGKSSVGRVLAKKLRKTFIDIDKQIEMKAGKTIAHIFKEEGEPAFREMERIAISELSCEEEQVIACGGGVILNPSNITNLKQNAVVIYLQASASEIKKRVSLSKGKRPLLAGKGGLDQIEFLMATRRPLYESAADIKVETSKLGIEAITEAIANRLREYEGFNF